MLRKYSFALFFLVTITLLIMGLTSAGAAYPDRPIKMIVPWAAGGDTDAICRVIAASMEKNLGKPVVIVNITGASGTVGAREAKKAAPDGYTILSVHDFIHTTLHTGVADLSYKDFEPVCLLTSTPSVFAAYGKTPWKSMKELIEDAKKRPEQITVGATLGSTSHFFPAMIAQAAGIKWKYVSYEGTAPRMTALLGGHVLVGETNLTQLDKVKAGQLKMFAIATAKRLPEIPDVPTLKELGIDIVYAVNRGIVAPKGTPEAALAKLEEACAKASKDPAVMDSMKKQGTFVEFLDRKAYADFLQKNDKINADLAQALGYKKK
ncbi:MAG TPA: tripartite tricarboxylate transporter substrate binding protein [Thermodesulfobacteriota bacterium]|nr:tripartite tricarboxylate transporter substrate binding protein [Thermodesulfobacteriota bacterium]